MPGVGRRSELPWIGPARAWEVCGGCQCDLVSMLYYMLCQQWLLPSALLIL